MGTFENHCFGHYDSVEKHMKVEGVGNIKENLGNLTTQIHRV